MLVFLLEESNAKKTRHTVQAPGLRKARSSRQQVLRGACSAAHPGREDNTGERVRHALAEGVPGISSCESTVRSVPAGRKVRQGDGCRPYRTARGDPKIFWDRSNWQPLCKKCHDRKTMTEDRYPVYKY